MFWQIKAFVSVGPLSFGMGREKARQALGSEFTPYRKGPNSTNDTDAYKKTGAHLCYDEQDKLNAVQISSYGGLSVAIDQMELLQVGYEELVQRLGAARFVNAEDGTGGYLKDQGVSIYRHLPADRHVSAVLVMSRPYFEEWLLLVAQISQRRKERRARRLCM